MKALNTVSLVLSKILEVCCWIGVVVLILGLIACIALPKQTILDFAETLAKDNALMEEIDKELAEDPDLAAAGIHLSVSNLNLDKVVKEDLPKLRTGGVVGCIGGAILAALTAMILRNVYLIIRTTKGETWFSKGATPFQPDVIRMLREIGIFAIVVPVLSLILNLILQGILGPQIIDADVNLMGILLGLLVLWLTQVFTYGAKLEQDAEGLI